MQALQVENTELISKKKLHIDMAINKLKNKNKNLKKDVKQLTEKCDHLEANSKADEYKQRKLLDHS